MLHCASTSCRLADDSGLQRDAHCTHLFSLQHVWALLGYRHLAGACDAAYHLHEDTTAMQQLKNAGEYHHSMNNKKCAKLKFVKIFDLNWVMNFEHCLGIWKYMLHLVRSGCAGFDLLLRDAGCGPAPMLQDLLAIPSVEVLPATILNPIFAKLSVSSLLTYVPQLSNHFNPGQVIVPTTHPC